MPLLLLFAAYAVALTIYLARAGHRSSRAAQGATGVELGIRGRLLVVGATGGTGRELVAQALARGWEVTALARDPSKLGLTHPNLVVARGDVMEPATLDQALQSCAAVVCALGHKQFLGPSRILSDGTRNLIEAMRRQGATRLVVETSLGLGYSAGRLGLAYTLFTLPVVLPFYFADKARQERMIAGSDLEWVIVRPGALTHGPARGRYRQGRRAGDWLATRSIARADVAAFMLDQLASNRYARTAVGLSD
jgi:putative NADH-flavin reductase